jgi:hypothetical protein
MKNEYGKDYQSNKGRSYQAAPNKSDNTYRNPNAPTQGGFSTPGGGTQGQYQGQYPKEKAPQQKNPQNKSNNTWGTGSLKNDKDSRK